MSNTVNTKARPTHRLYSVTKPEGEKATWNEIAAAWPHKDGKGFNLKFSAPVTEGAILVFRSAPAKKKGGAQ